MGIYSLLEYLMNILVVLVHCLSLLASCEMQFKVILGINISHAFSVRFCFLDNSDDAKYAK